MICTDSRTNMKWYDRNAIWLLHLRWAVVAISVGCIAFTVGVMTALESVGGW